MQLFPRPELCMDAGVIIKIADQNLKHIREDSSRRSAAGVLLAARRCFANDS